LNVAEGEVVKAKLEEQRINLNDLLKKAKDQKKEERKANLIIVSGVLSVALVVILILSL
tara:strand:- start:134 stop:310 length:177 start_codon:yes stop_codon:yes gene_type:complete